MALAAVMGMGCGAVLLGAGRLAGDTAWLAAGGVLAGTGLLVLVAGSWLDPVAAVLLAIPLPALVATDGLRIAAVAPVAGLAALGGFLRPRSTGGPADLGALPRRTGALLLVSMAAAAAVGPYPLVSAREVLNVGVLAAFTVLAVAVFRRRPSTVERTVSLLVAVAAVVGALAVLQAAGVIPGSFPRHGTGYQRAALGFGQPNGLGLFLAVVTPLAVHRAGIARTPATRGLWRCALAAVVAGLAATFSRGSWFSVVAGLTALFLVGEGRAGLRAATGVAIAVVAVDLGSGGMVRDTVIRTFGDWVLEQRAALAWVGVLMFLDHPLTGVGPGGFAPSLDRYGAQLPQLFEDLPTPHNAYVQMAAEVGLPGLLAYVAFLGVSLVVFGRMVRRGTGAPPDDRRRGLRRALLWSLAVVAWTGWFVWPFSHGAGEAVAVVLALGFAVAGERPQADLGPGERAAAAGRVP